MTLLLPALLAAVLAMTVCAGCDADGPTSAVDPSPTPSIELTHTGGCGDAFFWATSADDALAVVVTTDLRDRSATEPTELEVTLPDPRVEVELWAGAGLTSLMCNDVVAGTIDEKVPVVEGDVRIALDPRRDADFTSHVDGKAELSGLVTADGTPLPDLAIKTSSIGFSAG
jgi:hypothetical protein